MADVDLTYLEHNIRSRNDDVIRHASDLRPVYSRRTVQEDTTTKCYNLQPQDLVISRSTLIITLTFCGLITLLSLLVLLKFVWKQHKRRLELDAAKTWGRRSHFNERDNKRVSYASKGIDDEFTRRYRGVLSNTFVENSEMRNDGDVELGLGLKGEKDEVVRAPVIVDVELEDVDLDEGHCAGETTRKYEVVDGRVRPKVPGKSAARRKVRGRSSVWLEGFWTAKT